MENKESYESQTEQTKENLKNDGMLRNLEKVLGFKNDIKWKNFIMITLYHYVFIYAVYHYMFPVKWQTVVLTILFGFASGFGVTVGAHRYWCHRTFKATLPLKICTLVCFSVAGLNSLKQWVRDHRVHHKYSDTDADPHNVNRGLFFSHMGWLMLKKNDEVIRRGQQVDMSEFDNDPLLRFFEKYFVLLKLVLCYVLQMAIGVWLGDTWQTAGTWVLSRQVIGMHITFSVNSFAHAYGYKPYNKDLKPVENHVVAALALGEGWHNFHHTFPFDYKAAEFGGFLNLSAAVIRICERLGLAYDLREATPEMIAAIAAKSGDGSHLSIPFKNAFD